MAVRPVADVQDLADVPQCEPGGLSLADEGQPVEDRAVIVAVARRGPGRQNRIVLAGIPAWAAISPIFIQAP